MPRKNLNKDYLYCLVCEEAGICGGTPTRKETQEWEKENDLDKCPSKHKIILCQVVRPKKLRNNEKMKLYNDDWYWDWG